MEQKRHSIWRELLIRLGVIEMIVWVNKTESGQTELKGYNKSMQVITSMVESGDDWTITSRSCEQYQMKGAVCPDPIEFIFKLISPRKKMEIDDSVPYLRFQSNTTGELWEVWGVR